MLALGKLAHPTNRSLTSAGARPGLRRRAQRHQVGCNKCHRRRAWGNAILRKKIIYAVTGRTLQVVKPEGSPSYGVLSMVASPTIDDSTVPNKAVMRCMPYLAAANHQVFDACRPGRGATHPRKRNKTGPQVEVQLKTNRPASR